MPHGRTASISVSTATIVKCFAIALGLWVLWYLRGVFALFVASLLLATLIEPLAAWMHARRLPRGLAVLLIYLCLCILIALIAILLLPVLIDQIRGLTGYILSLSDTTVQSYDRLRELSAEFGFEKGFHSAAASFETGVTEWLTSLFSTMKGIVSGIVGAFIIFVMTFYLVVEEDAARTTFRQFTPKKYQPRIVAVLQKIQEKIGGWLRGQLILGFIIGSTAYLCLLFLHVPYALLLGLIAGLLEIVPYLGPITSVIPAALLGFTVSPMTGLLVLLFYLVIQQLENNLLVPAVMRKTTGLNPVVSILALLIGARIGGLIGVILAIPVAIIGMVILEEIFEKPRPGKFRR